MLCIVQTMYFVDTYSSNISEFRTDEQGIPVKGESGRYERREVVKVPQEEGIPDGMTIDRQVACTLIPSFTTRFPIRPWIRCLAAATLWHHSISLPPGILSPRSRRVLALLSHPLHGLSVA